MDVQGIDWGILERGMERSNRQFQQSIELGMQGMERRRTANALLALQKNPDDEKALRQLYGTPGGVEAVEKLRAGVADREYRNALSDYYGGPGGSFVQDASSDPSSPSRAAGVQPSGNALTNALMPNQSPAPGGMERVAQPSPVPADPRRAAIARMFRANPKAAGEFMKLEREQQKAQLELLTEVNDRSLAILGSVTDDASLAAAKQQARVMYQQYGLDPSFIDQIPDRFDPGMIRQLQLQGLSTKEQLSHLLEEDKFDWQMKDDQLDNERDERRVRVSERNTDSLIDYREDQVGLGRERNEISRESDADDVVATTVNGRGETVALRRDGTTTTLRHSVDPRGGKGRGGRSGGNDRIGPVYTRGNQRVQYSKSAGGYVDLSTGQRVD